MSFVEEKKFDIPQMKKPFYRKLGWKIFFVSLGAIILSAVAFLAYLFASGSNIFESGISGSSILKSLYGEEDLKGRNGRVNFLLMGMGGANHPGGMLADSLIFASLDTNSNKLAMLSIPRDLLVPIPGDGEDKINSAFATGYNNYNKNNCSGKKNTASCRSDAYIAGAKLMNETVSKVLNQPIDYYLLVDFNGFEKLIDQLGGIDVQVDKTISDPYFPDKTMTGYEPFYIKAGSHHLDGVTALKYARSRHTTSDFDRAKRQQKIILAVKDKALNLDFLSNPKKLSDLINTLGSSLKTNLSIPEGKTLFGKIKDINQSNITSYVLTSGPNGLLTDYNNGTYYLKPKDGTFKEIKNLAANIFEQESLPESAKIELLNGSGTPGVAADLGQEMKDIGYNIVNIANTTKTAKTVIYDYSNGQKQKTLEYLKKKTGGEVITKSNPQSQIDISVVIGQDFNQ